MKEFPECTGFEWDAGNRDKNLKHSVEYWECEQMFFNQPLVVLEDLKHSAAEERFAAFGQTDAGRRLTVIFTFRKRNIRVISARDMHKKERKFYETHSQNQA